MLVSVIDDWSLLMLIIDLMTRKETELSHNKRSYAGLLADKEYQYYYWTIELVLVPRYS